MQYHPIAILDRASNGTEYSTRAAAASAAAAEGGKFAEYHQALFANQPAEGSAGLTNAKLIELGKSVGLTDAAFADAVTDKTYEAWVTKVTDTASSRGVTGTPTVLVNGGRSPSRTDRRRARRRSRRRWRRPPGETSRPDLAVVAGALVVPAAPASAHGGDAPDGDRVPDRGHRRSRPPQPGLTRPGGRGRRAAGADQRDRAHRSRCSATPGEPYLEVRPDGTYENVNSPAAYLNQTLTGDTPVPAAADPTAPPQWRRVSAGTTVRWHDQRTHWLGDGLPPAGAGRSVAQPSAARLERCRCATQTRTFEIRGTLDWVPPPDGLAVVGGRAAAGRRGRLPPACGGPRSGPAVALVAGAISLGYAVSRTHRRGGCRSCCSWPALVAVAACCLAVAAVPHWRWPARCWRSSAASPTRASFGAAVVPARRPGLARPGRRAGGDRRRRGDGGDRGAAAAAPRRRSGARLRFGRMTESPPRAGDAAPDFTLPTDNGDTARP